MRKGKFYLAMAALVVAILAAMSVVVGCGGSDQKAEAGEPSPSTALSGSAADRAQTILGKAPTGLAAKIVERGSVIVANDSNYPPQSSIDQASGELVGFDVDVAKKMGQVLGLEVKFENPAWETILPGLQTGKWDVSIGSMTSAIAGERTDPTIAERWNAADFTAPYYYTSGQLFVKQGGPQVTDPAQLAGKKVGVGAGTTYYSWLKENTDAKVKTYTTDADCFPDLRNGNLDFVMTAGPTGQQAILSGQPFEFSGAPLYYEDLSMAIKKGETDWLTMLDYAVKTMHEDGSLSDMSKAWYNGLDLTVQE
jgi:ABC-type amino acid transport substrate-binding protein